VVAVFVTPFACGWTVDLWIMDLTCTYLEATSDGWNAVVDYLVRVCAGCTVTLVDGMYTAFGCDHQNTLVTGRTVGNQNDTGGDQGAGSNASAAQVRPVRASL
jgi:hypothetical protein